LEVGNQGINYFFIFPFWLSFLFSLFFHVFRSAFCFHAFSMFSAFWQKKQRHEKNEGKQKNEK